MVKNLPANTKDIRDASSIPGLGRSPGEGNDREWDTTEQPATVIDIYIYMTHIYITESLVVHLKHCKSTTLQ